MKIGIVAKIDSNKSLELSKKIIEYLLERDIEVCLDSPISANFPEYEDLEVQLNDMEADMVITLGGDGTILRTQSFIRDKKIPMLSINMGTLGFLTEVEPEDTFRSLEEVLSGNYFIEERTGLKVTHGHELPSALNEVVIMTQQPAKMLNIEISVDGEIVEELSADGIIISTSSGSTAYSMSAGGPIVDPKVGAFLIVPICPFKLGARPWVVSEDSIIKIKLLKKGKKAVAVIDGQYQEELDYLEEIIFKKSEKPNYFVKLSSGFYKKVREKLAAGGI